MSNLKSLLHLPHITLTDLIEGCIMAIFYRYYNKLKSSYSSNRAMSIIFQDEHGVKHVVADLDKNGKVTKLYSDWPVK